MGPSFFSGEAFWKSARTGLTVQLSYCSEDGHILAWKCLVIVHEEWHWQRVDLVTAREMERKTGSYPWLHREIDSGCFLQHPAPWNVALPFKITITLRKNFNSHEAWVLSAAAPRCDAL
ncbi:hypothetical protein HYFRA_00012209 [Hymenoscyphus fraxineus]|uniref:Uncharacterized protein n=1 Tax=Hymenoscyphus fraxineus TaxID=746836 RepID=A0A9N9KYB4_9HELO|nr:hypothetical protein HYFRA_00012209 [Hymenoscyphus fraxineus]